MYTYETITDDDTLKFCIALYLKQNDESFVPSSHSASLINLRNRIAKGSIFRVIKKDNEIVGWFLADVMIQDFSSVKMLVISYYTSNLKGYAAACCALKAHRYLIKKAELLKLTRVFAQCNHMDVHRVLCKLLERDGWKIRSYAAIFETKHARLQPS